MPPRLELALVRRLALHAQGLAAPPPPGQTVEDVVARIGCLQLDPVSAVARSPLLVLQARLRATATDALLDGAAYGRRQLFDYWCHEASLCWIGDLALHRWQMRRWLVQPWRRAYAEFLRENTAFADELVAAIAERGPVRASELEDTSVAHWAHGHWTDEVSSRQTIARMLDVLWMTGRVGVFDRVGTARRWHVLEACLPAGALDDVEELDDREAVRRAAIRAVRMLGAARVPHVRDHFTRRRYPGLEEVLAAEPSLVEVDVGGRSWWVHEEDLERAPSLPEGRRTVALSPFDNLLCDRERTTELFGFDHRLEIYVPQAQRRWGYYVLPILHGERFVARADLKLDRPSGELRVLALHHEPGRKAPAAVERALDALARRRGATLVP